MKRDEYTRNMMDLWVGRTQSLSLKHRNSNLEDYLQYLVCVKNLNRQTLLSTGCPKRFFKEVLFYKEWAKLDLRYDLTTPPLTFKGQVKWATSKQVFCSIKLGAHYALLRYFWEQQLPITVLEKDIEAVEYIQKQHCKWLKKNKRSTSSFRVHLYNPNGQQIRQAIEANRNVLIYIDHQVNPSYIQLEDGLLNEIAANGIDLTPVVSYKEDNLTFVCESSSNINVRATNSLELLNNFYRQYIKRYPTQWSVWVESIPYSPPKEAIIKEVKAYSFNAKTYAFYQFKQKNFLLDVSKGRAVKVSSSLFSIIYRLKDKVITKKELYRFFSSSLVNDLLSSQVLIPFYKPF